MRTNILIDDDLMEAAMQATGVKSKKETVELGLQTLVRLYQQQNIRDFKGKLLWDGDFDPFVEHLGLISVMPAK